MRQIKQRMLLLALPFILIFMTLYVLPFGMAVYYSLVHSTLDLRFVGLMQYAETLQNQYFQLAMANTLKFTTAAVPLLLLLAMMLALPLARNRAGWIGSILLLPLLLPSASVSLLFRTLFDRWNGILTYVWTQAGFSANSMPLLSLHAFFLWKNIGLLVCILTSAMVLIPPARYDFVRLEGASAFQKWWHVTLPHLRPTIVFTAMMTCMYSFRIFRESWLMYSSYPHTSIYLLQNYMNNHFYKVDYQRLSSAGILFLVLIYMIVGIAYRLDVRWRAEM